MHLVFSTGPININLYMEVRVRTNRSRTEPEHRISLTVSELRSYVFPRFGNIPNGRFKVVRWRNKGGLSLHFKKNQSGVVVGFEESGHGVADTYYTMDELEGLILESMFK